MKLSYVIVNQGIKSLFRALLRMDDADLVKIPEKGPLIIVSNHINSIEVPVMMTHFMPRPVTGLAKVETWDNPLLRYLFDMWEIIPIERGTADLHAIRTALQALEQGKIVVITPEGTRTRNGRLLRGKPGIVPLAIKSRAPILPMAFYGNEVFWANLKRLRRTDFRIRVGQQFRVEAYGATMDRETRQAITDEIMYRLAALLPPQYRGFYTDDSKATSRYLQNV